MPTDGILDGLVGLYAQAAAPILAQVIPVALGLAGLLFTLQIAWDGAMWVLLDADHLFGKAVRKGAIFFVLYGLISIVPVWLPEILQGFETLGQRVTGLAGLSPSGIFSQGLDLGFTFFNSWSRVLTSVIPGIGFFRLFSMLFVILAFALIAIQLARVLIEGALALGGLVIFLAFWGHKLTFGLAEGYLRYVLDVGVRIYVLFLLVSVGRDLGRTWDLQLQGLGLVDFRLHFTIFAAVLLFTLLVWTLPKDIASRIAGGFSMSGLNPMKDSHG